MNNEILIVGGPNDGEIRLDGRPFFNVPIPRDLQVKSYLRPDDQIESITADFYEYKLLKFPGGLQVYTHVDHHYDDVVKLLLNGYRPRLYK